MMEKAKEAQRERDRRRRVVLPSEHATRHHSQHGVARDALVAASRDHDRRWWRVRLRRPALLTLAQAVTDDPERASGPAAGVAALRTAGWSHLLDRRHALQPALDAERTVNDSCLAPIFLQRLSEHDEESVRALSSSPFIGRHRASRSVLLGADYHRGSDSHSSSRCT